MSLISNGIACCTALDLAKIEDFSAGDLMDDFFGMGIYAAS